MSFTPPTPQDAEHLPIGIAAIALESWIGLGPVASRMPCGTGIPILKGEEVVCPTAHFKGGH